MRHLLLARTYQEARTFAYNHCIPRGCWAFIIDFVFIVILGDCDGEAC